MAGPSIIPDGFASRKRKILAELSIPDVEYTDLSPKGSVDEGIRDLINEINGLSGLVTTSSCAGRISVFLEGRRPQLQQQQQRHTQHQQQQQDENQQGERERRFAPSGGKGAGKWLYVSHEPLPLTGPSDGSDKHKRTLHELFGMIPGGDGKPPNLFNADSPSSGSTTAALRLVRFHFEPMILHIMAATLGHAQPVLAAASSSGFRESGLQSLRCLDGDDGPSPIVAVRSSGLSLESIIGYCESSSLGDVEGGDEKDEEPVVRSLVSEEYLRMLVALSNERFLVNTERKERFRAILMDLYSRRPDPGTGAKENNAKARGPDWEDAETRRARKRAEGLQRKQQQQQLERPATSTSNEQDLLEEEEVEGIADTL